MLLKTVIRTILALAALSPVLVVAQTEYDFAAVPPLPRATSAPDSLHSGPLELRQGLDFDRYAPHQVQERQLTLTPGAQPTPIFVPLADPKDSFSACFWGIGNKGQSVYKVAATAPSGNSWDAYLLEGPTGASLYHDQLTTVVNGTLKTVIASATCSYEDVINRNYVATADCNYMAMIDPPSTSWYRYQTVITATYTPKVCNLSYPPKPTSWDIGSGNGVFDPNPDSVPGSWASRRSIIEAWGMASVWAVFVIGTLAVLGLITL
ncbi:hypothetical protein V8E36_003605 [Tilletia maclaganii]